MLGLLDTGELDRALEADTYGLLPAFVDGWLDEMPATMRVIEGTEDIGYRANSPAEYDGAFTRLTLGLPLFVAPEHRAQVRRQFRVGHSLYLDAYANPPGSNWYIDPLGSTPAARLAVNLTSAFAASDGLVWLYGEQGRWWPSGDAKQPVWPERLPGLIAAIRRAKDPTEFARGVLARTPPSANLLANGDFSARGPAPDGPPTGWFDWQDDSSHGRVTGAPGQVELSGVLEGCVGCLTPVKPGHTYIVRVRAKSEGQGLASLDIGWKTADGKWTAYAQDRRFVGDRPADADGWREIVGLVEVPPGAGQISFAASAHGQTSPADRCWFKDAALVEVGG
jgi:hypothetical protein